MKTITLLLAVLSLNAQSVSFKPHQDLAAGQNATYIAVADLDHDGRPDLVIAFADGHVSCFFGDGAGGFAREKTILQLPGTIMYLTAADLNHDKSPDLIVATEMQTYVLMGQGDGTFKPALSPAPLSYPLFIADVTGDGIPDLVQWGNTPGCIFYGLRVLEGRGDGSFRAPTGRCIVSDSGSMTPNVAVGLLNSDQAVDFIWSGGRSDNYSGIFLGTGTGEFSPPLSTGVSKYVGGGGRSLALGDMNEDRLIDFVSALGGVITVFARPPDGSFPGAGVDTLVPVLAASHNTTNGLFIADLNRDGHLDVIWGNCVLPGRGDGTFAAPAILQGATAEGAVQAVADLNGDGLPDLISFFYESRLSLAAVSKISVFLNAASVDLKGQIAYSSASGLQFVAPGSFGSIFGSKLSPQTAIAPTGALPTQLGGISLRTRDSANVVRLAPLIYVSPAQINFLVPPDTAPGLMTFTIDDGSPTVQESANATPVYPLAPAFFVQNGIPAATAVRVLPANVLEPVPVTICPVASTCSLAAIDLSKGAVYLTLYGTGFRNILPPPPGQTLGLTCTVGGVNAAVTFAGAQPASEGLDQLNLLIPAKVPHGLATVQCIFPQFAPAANSVQISIQ